MAKKESVVIITDNMGFADVPLVYSYLDEKRALSAFLGDMSFCKGETEQDGIKAFHAGRFDDGFQEMRVFKRRIRRPENDVFVVLSLDNGHTTKLELVSSNRKKCENVFRSLADARGLYVHQGMFDKEQFEGCKTLNRYESKPELALVPVLSH